MSPTVHLEPVKAFATLPEPGVATMELWMETEEGTKVLEGTASCGHGAADPAGAGPEAVVASRLLVALARLARRVDDAAARAPKAAERVVAALVDGVDTLDALCRAVVASCVEIKILRRVRAESSTRRTG